MFSEKTKAELQLKSALVEFETKKLEMERSTAEYTRDRDQEMLALKRGGESELKRFEVERERLVQKIQALEMQARHSSRKPWRRKTWQR